MALEAPLRSSTGSLQFSFPHQSPMSAPAEKEPLRSPGRVVYVGHFFPHLLQVVVITTSSTDVQIQFFSPACHRLRLSPTWVRPQDDLTFYARYEPE